MSEQNTTDMSQHFYRASAADFMKIKGFPLAYWVSNSFRMAFSSNKAIKDIATTKQGMATGDNNKFLRLWYEVDNIKVGYGYNSREAAIISGKKWFSYNKGGAFQKWYGNNEIVIDWFNDGENIETDKSERLKAGLIEKKNSECWNKDFYFRESVSWSKVSSGNIAVRYFPPGFIFDVAGCSVFSESKNILYFILALMNSNLSSQFLAAISPTLNYEKGQIEQLPIALEKLQEHSESISEKVEILINLTKKSYTRDETSIDFKSLPIISFTSIKTGCECVFHEVIKDIENAANIEKELNDTLANIYELQTEVKSEVPFSKITILDNPFFLYGDLGKDQVKSRYKSGAILNILSFSIGCMMGRYSLDREGLVYAHAGNQGFAELVSEGAYTKFSADDDAILPITEQEWFSDDVTNRVSEFVRTVYGEQQLEENLQFIADSLCLYAIKPKKDERVLETIRRYLGTQFYKDHLKTYKRRPIYWLFSSGKHKAFECLVYLHRYHEGTLARMRTEYVIPLTARINARINRLHEEVEAASSTSERKQLMTELKTLQNQQAELATFDEQLRHHADQRISLDLDDGVKENYGKFGDLLAAVKDVTGKAAD